jgi:hypothetical protein
LPAWQLTAIAGLIAAAWLGLLLGWLAWRRRRRDPVHAMWQTLCRRLGRAGIPRHPSEGPLAYTTRAGQRWPEFAAVFGVIGEAYAQLRYGADGGLAARSERHAAAKRLRRALQLLPPARQLART